MKVVDILAKINATIDKHAITYRKNTDPIQCIFTTYVITKLKWMLERCVNTNPNKELNARDVQQLILFNNEIFEIVRDTDMVATHSPHSLFNVVLLELATQLCTISKLNKYQILMPTITRTEYEASYRSINDPDLQLNDFVLSDDGTAIIEVFNSLSQASIHGELKHTYLVGGQAELLSKTEQKRVIYHSRAAEEYWEAIQKRMDITLRGENFGAVLQRLVDNLRKGGMHGVPEHGSGGTDDESGTDSHMAIINFFAWYNSLCEDDKKIITDNANLLKLIERLNPTVEADYSTSIYCVEIIADGIETELRNNPELFKIYPKNTPPKYLSGIEEANIRVAITETALQKAMLDHNYTVRATYGVQSYIKFVTRVANIKDLFVYISPKELNAIFTPELITAWVSKRLEIDRLSYLAAVTTILDFIEFPSWRSIANLLKTLPFKNEQVTASKIFVKQICKVTSTVEVLKAIGDFFGQDFKDDIYKTLYETEPEKFKKNSKLYNHIKGIQQKPRRRLIPGII